MRILVTGSRDWEDVNKIWHAILEQDPCAEHGECNEECPKITIVHGACPTGADAIANDVAGAWGVEIEAHPAEWDKYGKRAGFIRNSKMVELGADICLAFIRNKSKGSTMTANTAERAGIPTVRYEIND